MPSKKVKKLEGQSIYDIAIQEYGDIDGTFQILKDNPELDLETTIPNGFDIVISKPPINKDVVNIFIEAGLKPANEYLGPNI